jgi:hypothetical protein
MVTIGSGKCATYVDAMFRDGMVGTKREGVLGEQVRKV